MFLLFLDKKKQKSRLRLRFAVWEGRGAFAEQTSRGVGDAEG